MATKGFILLIILISQFPYSLSLKGLVQGAVAADHHVLQGKYNSVAVSGGTGTRSGGSSPGAAGGGVIPVYAAGSTDQRNNNGHSAGNSIRGPTAGVAALRLFITISLLANLYQFV